MTLKVLGVYFKDTPPSQPVVNQSPHSYHPVTIRQEHTWISVQIGGVLNDFYYFPPTLVKKNNIEYIRRRINEVNIFSKEELDNFNEKFGTNVLGGGVGENILVEGANLNYLALNTILKIGNEVLLQVVGRRSLCRGFISSFFKKNNFTSIDYSRFDRTKIGLATQVIRPGIIKISDVIEIIEPNAPVVQMIPNTANTLLTATLAAQFQLYNPTDPTILPVPDFDPRLVPDIE